MKIKAVLDTNVFISGVFWKGPPFEILKAWQEERFRLAISLPILQEYRRVLDELTKERAVPVLTSVLKIIELHSEIVEPVSFVEPVCIDHGQVPGSQPAHRQRIRLVAEYEMNKCVDFGFGCARMCAGQFLETATRAHD